MSEYNINEQNFPPVNQNTSPTPKNKSNEFLLVPYLGKPSLKFQKRIREELRHYGVDILPAYSTTKVASYFDLKTKLSTLFKANVVYKFTSACDKTVSYIGETRRQLFRRIKEHQEDGKNSAVFSHLFECTPCQNTPNIVDCFKILQSGTCYNVLNLESLLIAKHRPNLNVQMGPGKETISRRLYR